MVSKIKLFLAAPIMVGVFTTVAFMGVTLFLWYAATLRDEAAVSLSIIFSTLLSILLGVLAGVVRYHSNTLETRVEERTRELEEKNKAFLVQTKKAEEAARLKVEFVNTMSHELKTPLNAIIGFTDILLEELQGPLNEGQKDSLRRLAGSAEDLHVLVSNILNLSKVEADQMQLSLSRYSPNMILDEIESMVPALKKEKHVDVILKRDSELKSAVGDVVKIKQIVTNLLTNAIKFTKEGQIVVTTKKDGDQVIFTVVDTGIGIPENITPIIFDAFRQADGSIRRKYGGTGLGLHIVRLFVERMQGSLNLDSKEGQGTSITVALPLKVAQN
jgi:signal transduction histidine kinase